MENQTVGQRIRALRKEKKLTQAQLAKISGVSAPAVTEWEKDGYLPKTVPLQAMADYFGVTTDYIMYGNFEKEKNTNEVNSKRAVYGAATIKKTTHYIEGLDGLIDRLVKMGNEGRLTEDFIKSIESLVTVVEKAQDTKDQVVNGTAPDTKSA